MESAEETFAMDRSRSTTVILVEFLHLGIASFSCASFRQHTMVPPAHSNKSTMNHVIRITIKLTMHTATFRPPKVLDSGSDTETIEYVGVS